MDRKSWRLENSGSWRDINRNGPEKDHKGPQRIRRQCTYCGHNVNPMSTMGLLWSNPTPLWSVWSFLGPLRLLVIPSGHMAGFRGVQTVRPNRAPQIYGPHILNSRASLNNEEWKRREGQSPIVSNRALHFVNLALDWRQSLVSSGSFGPG